MSDEEERADELEVLQSIYADEFSWISEPSNFAIILAPPNDGDEEVHVQASLQVKYPDDYPSSSIPEFELNALKGLSKKQIDEMHSLAISSSEEQQGMPSVFSVCEALKEWLLDNNVPGQDDSMYAQMLRREQIKDLADNKKEKIAKITKLADNEGTEESIDPEELERIRRRQAGHPCTPESFAIWKAKFESEMKIQAKKDFDAGLEIDRMQMALLGLDINTSLSGKEIWLTKISKGSVDDTDDPTVAHDETGNMLNGKKSDNVGDCDDDDDDGNGEEDRDYEAKLYAEFAARKAAKAAANEEEWSGSDESSEYEPEEGDEDFDDGDDDDDDDDDVDYAGDNTVFKGATSGSRPVTRGMKNGGK